MRARLVQWIALASVVAFGVTALPAEAATSVQVATGTPGLCPAAGQIDIKPALVAGRSTASSIKVKTKPRRGGECTGGSGDGTEVASMQSAGTGAATLIGCGSSLSIALAKLKLTVKWKMRTGATTKKIANSTFTFSKATGSISTSPPNHLEFDVLTTDATVTAGSFIGDTVAARLVTDPDVTELGNACRAQGIKRIRFGAKASQDDGQVGSGAFILAP